MWLGIFVAFIYGVVAVAANFVNKYAVQVLPLPVTILLAQTLTTVIILRVMAGLQLVRLPSLRALRVQQLASLAICYSVHAVLVLYSLAFLSIPMYNVLKRLTPVMVLACQGVMDGRWPDLQTTLSVLLIVSGCLVAGAGDLSFDLQGYALALFCAFMQSIYILLAERASAGGGGGAHTTPRRKHHSSGVDLQDVEAKRSDSGHTNEHGLYLVASGRSQLSLSQGGSTGGLHGDGGRGGGVRGGGSVKEVVAGLIPKPLAGSSSAGGESSGPISATELLYSICVISLPALAAVCVITGEGARAPMLLGELRAKMGPASFIVWLGITAVTEGLLTGSVILCTQMNSALTTSIVGVLKGAVSSVLGFFLLGGVKFHAVNVAGICMNMAGGVWYSGVQYAKSKSGG